jgi:hypothetical protein
MGCNWNCRYKIFLHYYIQLWGKSNINTYLKAGSGRRVSEHKIAKFILFIFLYEIHKIFDQCNLTLLKKKS